MGFLNKNGCDLLLKFNKRQVLLPLISASVFLFFNSSCVTNPGLKYEKGKTEDLKQIKEFEQEVKIVSEKDKLASAQMMDSNREQEKQQKEQETEQKKGQEKNNKELSGLGKNSNTKTNKKSSVKSKEKSNEKSNAKSEENKNSQSDKANSENVNSEKISKKKKSSSAKTSQQLGEKSEVKSELVNENTPKTILPREPEFEGQKGFSGRRPLKDPFRVGEKVVFEVSYFGATAGQLTMEVLPFVEVNGQKSYNFKTSIKTSSFYSKIYSVDDFSNAYVNYETLIPSVYTMHVQETGQLRDARAYFDREKKIAKFWEKKITTKDGEELKKLEWAMEDYSQNVFSAAFYMRVFQWDVGVENSFRVAHDNENMMFKAKAIRRETIKTEAGEYKTLVIKPEITLKGVFKPMGDIYMWLTDDDRKLIVRIDSKIKIGTLVSEAIQIDRAD